MRHRASSFASGLFIAFAMARPLGAQGPIMDAGLSVVHFIADSTWVVGPSLRLTATGTHGPWFGTMSGGGVLTVGAASGSATVSGGGRSRLATQWVGELEGELSSVAGSGTNGAAGTAAIGGRALWLAGNGGMWLKTAGQSSDRAHSTLTGLGVETGAWWKHAGTQLSASVNQQWTAAELFTGTFRRGYAGTVPVRYLEGSISLHHEGERASLDVTSVTRRDPDAAHLFERGGSVTSAVWLTDSFAFLMSVSRQLPDFVRGADALEAFSLGFRSRQQSPARARAAHIFVVVRVADSPQGRMVRVLAQGARTVEIMGDFTDWQAQALTERSGAFEAPVTLGSGAHRMLVRVDGGEWRAAANTPAVDDDLGGVAGLLVVP